MKLLTHNILTSKMLKNVVTGYPLKLIANKIEETKSDFQPEFIEKMIQRINYDALYCAAESVGCFFSKSLSFEFVYSFKVGHSDGLPNTAEFIDSQTDLLKKEEFVKKLHQVLLEIEIVEGELVCPETGRTFPIRNGIPNMLVNEDEH
jgi:multifunctional methyltransferase subunit TRM112